MTLRYAVIENNKVVNLIEMEHSTDTQFSLAVIVGDLPVVIGADYKEGEFYLGEQKIQYPTEALHDESLSLLTELNKAVMEVYSMDKEVIG